MLIPPQTLPARLRRRARDLGDVGRRRRGPRAGRQRGRRQTAGGTHGTWRHGRAPSDDGRRTGQTALRKTAMN